MTEQHKKVLEGKSILVMEDDEFISKVYLKWLRASGAEVYVAHNGLEGIETLEKTRVDLILLDLGMPGMNGYETVNRLKENANTKNLPIIVLSNTTLTPKNEEYVKLVSAGVTDIFRKYDTSLRQLIEMILKRL